MSVDSIAQISATSQAAANQALEEYLAKKKIIADELVDKAAKAQVTKDAQAVKDNMKMEDERFQEAKLLKADQAELYQVKKEAAIHAQDVKFLNADQAENYQIKKETDKRALEAKYAKMDAVATADASRFQAAKASLKADHDKASATIEQNTVALEDILAAKTSTTEANLRADNATALEMAHSNSINSKAGTEQAIEAYHDNMAKQNRLQAANTAGTAQSTGAETRTNHQGVSPTPHINVLD
jgi:hypothetical protein